MEAIGYGSGPVFVKPAFQRIPFRGGRFGGGCIRLAFNGETTRHPVVASLIMECQAPVNIVSADIREIDGKIYGQTILELPADEASAERARAWLKQDGVSFEEV